MTIELPPQDRTQAVASLKRYFSEELDQEIGDLKATLLLDYLLEEIGPAVYNRALADAQTFLRDRLADLDGVFEPEFPFWR